MTCHDTSCNVARWQEDKRREKERRSEGGWGEGEQERRSEEVRSRARNLRANERRADGCQPREMFKISEQLYFCCVAVAGERGRENGELGVSEARGSQSAMPLLGAVAVFWGSLRGLGRICNELLSTAELIYGSPPHPLGL